jgi:hypothetical protein
MILFPKNMEVSYSVDGENYLPFNTADFDVKWKMKLLVY